MLPSAKSCYLQSAAVNGGLNSGSAAVDNEHGQLNLTKFVELGDASAS